MNYTLSFIPICPNPKFVSGGYVLELRLYPYGSEKTICNTSSSSTNIHTFTLYEDGKYKLFTITDTNNLYEETTWGENWLYVPDTGILDSTIFESLSGMTCFSATSHNHALSSLAEKSYNSLSNLPNLNAFVTTASLTGYYSNTATLSAITAFVVVGGKITGVI